MTYEGPERRSSDELTALREATAELSEQVRALSQSLQVVAVLQARQQELEDVTGETRELTEQMIERTGLEADANARSRHRLWRRGVPGVALSLSVGYL